MCRMQPSISQLIRPHRYHHAVARTIRFIHMPPPGCSVSRLISCTQSNTRTTFSCVYTPSAFKQQLHVHVLGMGHSTKSQRLMMGVLAHNPHSMLVQYVGTVCWYMDNTTTGVHHGRLESMPLHRRLQDHPCAPPGRS